MFIPQTATSKVINALYNLNDDPFEMHNPIGNNPGQQKHKTKVNGLKNCLLAWLEKNHSKHLDGVKERIIVKNQTL